MKWNKARYERQIMLPDFGEAAQQKLANVKVLVVGAGGLGSSALLYLVAAGVGHIGIVEGDVLEISNLNRQVLYKEEELGLSKLELATRRLMELNSELVLDLYPVFLNTDNAQDLLAPYDLVLDCTDNYASRYALDAAASALLKTVVYAAVYHWEGQLSVFAPGYARLADVFGDEPEAPADAGFRAIIGANSGVMGSLQATEAIKVICQLGDVLYGKILVVNLLTQHHQVFEI